jgi:hypothetical protein
MSYSREAHEILEATLQTLLTRKGAMAYPTMVGYLMVNVALEDAQRISEMVTTDERKTDA